MFEPRTADPQRDVFALTQHRDHGMVGLAFMLALLAFALTIWALAGGIESIGSVDEEPASPVASVTTVATASSNGN